LPVGIIYANQPDSRVIPLDCDCLVDQGTHPPLCQELDQGREVMVAIGRPVVVIPHDANHAIRSPKGPNELRAWLCKSFAVHHVARDHDQVCIEAGGDQYLLGSRCKATNVHVADVQNAIAIERAGQAGEAHCPTINA